MCIVLDAQETKPTSSNILRMRSQVTTLVARLPGERERERTSQFAWTQETWEQLTSLVIKFQNHRGA